MKSKAIIVMVAVLFAFTGCAGMSKRTKCACVGAATGAAVGTTAGWIVGHNWKNNASPPQSTPGAWIGGASGALLGGIIGYLACKEEPRPIPPVAAVVVEPTCDKIVVNSIQFDFDKSVIKPEFEPVLDEAASELQKCPTASVVIEGHTDYIGSDEYNMKLGERRAASVKNYLVEKGLGSERLSTQSYGESKPVADNTSKKGRSMNRRVEFNIAQ